MKFLDDNKTE